MTAWSEYGRFVKRKRPTWEEIIAALASLPDPEIDTSFVASIEARLLTEKDPYETPLFLVRRGDAPVVIASKMKHRHVLIAGAAALAVAIASLALVLAIRPVATRLDPHRDFALPVSTREAPELYTPSPKERVRAPNLVAPRGNEPQDHAGSQCRLWPKGPPCRWPARAHTIELSQPKTSLQSQLL